MSWFQSSLGFVNSALNQAQKSIDKVLDISEDGDRSVEVPTQSEKYHKDSGADGQEMYLDVGGEMVPSLWSTPSKQKAPAKTTTTPGSSENDSFWNSFFDTPVSQKTTSPIQSESTQSAPHSVRETSTPKSSSAKEKRSSRMQRKKPPSPAKSPSEKDRGVSPQEDLLDVSKGIVNASEESRSVKDDDVSLQTPSVKTEDVIGESTQSDLELPVEVSPEILPPMPLPSQDEQVLNTSNVEETSNADALTNANPSQISHLAQVDIDESLGMDSESHVPPMAVAEFEEVPQNEPTSPEKPHSIEPAVVVTSRTTITTTEEHSGGSETETDGRDAFFEHSQDLPVEVEKSNEENLIGIQSPSAVTQSEEQSTTNTEEDHTSKHDDLDTGEHEEQDFGDINESPEIRSDPPAFLEANSDNEDVERCYSGRDSKEPLQSEHFATPVDSEAEDTLPQSSKEERETQAAGGPVVMLNQEELMPTTLTPFAGIPSEERQEELSKTENVEHCRQNSEATSVKQLDLPDDSKLVQIEEEVQMLQSELEQTKHVLTVRESKLLELSQMNVALSEENDTLKSELAFAPAKQNEEEGGIEDLKDEFARRIASVEKKLHQSLKDKEVLRKELQTLKTEKDAIGSKDEEIASLRAEGEKLSKQQLQSSETIKKLRKKEQENQKLISNLKKSADTAEEEISRLKEALQRREDNERKLQENLAKLNSFAEQQSFELSTVKGERDELSDKSRSLQTNLDNVYKEMSELKKANAASENAVKEATLSAELSAKEELKSLLEQTRRDYQQEKDMLSLQIADLRAGMSRAEQQASWREDQLRQELAALQSRLQEAESRNEDLSSSVSQATKPLLRQLENLQSVHSAQVANWEKVEGSLTERLNSAQIHLNEAQEKERAATEKQTTLQSKVSSLEAQIKLLRTEKTKLSAELEAERAELAAAEDGMEKITVKLESLKSTSSSTIDQLKEEKEAAEQLLELERKRFESEVKRAVSEAKEAERSKLSTELADTSFRRQGSSDSRPGSTSRSVSMDNSGLLWESSFSKPSSIAATAPAMEHFQSQLRQKEGELSNAQNLIASLEKSRSALMEEVTKLTAENGSLSKQVSSIPDVEAKMKELETRYDALLQMYGEKSEEAEELRLDLQDVKEMYRQQIEDLVGKSNLKIL